MTSLDDGACIMMIIKSPSFARKKRLYHRKKSDWITDLWMMGKRNCRSACLDLFPGNHAQLPRDGKRVSRLIEELGQAMCISSYRAVSHRDLFVCVCVRACVYYKPREWQINNKSHLLKVWVSYSPLYPEIPRTGWQLNSDCNVCLSIHVSPRSDECLSGTLSIWVSVPSNCALSRGWSMDTLFLMSTPSRCDRQTPPTGAQQPPPFFSVGSPLHDFKDTVSGDAPQSITQPLNNSFNNSLKACDEA